MRKNIFYILMIIILIFVLIILYVKKDDINVGASLENTR